MDLSYGFDYDDPDKGAMPYTISGVCLQSSFTDEEIERIEKSVQKLFSKTFEEIDWNELNDLRVHHAFYSRSDSVNVMFYREGYIKVVDGSIETTKAYKVNRNEIGKLCDLVDKLVSGLDTQAPFPIGVLLSSQSKRTGL